MSDQLESTVVHAPPKPQQQPPKPKRQPQFGVFVHNDEDHTFAYVIETFQKVFGYNQERCLKLALDIHNNGKTVVWAGWKEVAELKADLIRSAGKDYYAIAGPVSYPLGCHVEALPG